MTEHTPTIYERLARVQAELHVPKTRFNTHMRFNYRNCEDIIEEAKPVLAKHGLLLSIGDEVVEVGGHNYIRASAIVWTVEGDASWQVQGWAREAITQQGSAPPQLTGAASSYARKYALNGLFALDDTRDDDTDEQTNNRLNARSASHAAPSEEKRGSGGYDLPSRNIDAPRGTQRLDADLEPNLASDAQRRKIYAMTKERAMSEEAAKAMVKALTGKESTKEITKREASQIIDHLNEMGSNEHAHGSQHYQEQDPGLDEEALNRDLMRRIPPDQWTD
jgi:hypothetical protein